VYLTLLERRGVAMTPMEWMALLWGFALLAFIVALGVLGLQGGQARHEMECSVRCPVRHETVSCRLVKDVRIGQFRDVASCSAFAEPEKVTCERACLRPLNLGMERPVLRAA
jgi:hypothetical protein